MKLKALILVGVVLLVSGIWNYAQQPNPSPSPDAPVAMVQYQHMCMMLLHPHSPASIVAWKDQLGLNDAQTSQLQAIQDKAVRDAEAVLNEDQRNKLNSLTAGWNPQTPMQCMRGMMGTMGNQMPTMMMCPMMQPTPAK